MFIIDGKVALITGALGGIGIEYTKALLKANIKGVSLIDISDCQLQTLLDVLSKNDQKKLFFIKCDVTDQKQLEDAYKSTIENFSQLDIVINNAGVLDEVNIDRTLSINLEAAVKSTFLAFRTYLPKYKKGKEGVIVNTSSIAGLMPFPMTPVYALTKSGLVSLGTSLGTEVHYNIRKVRIITICPSVTNSDLLKTYQMPEEYKELAKLTMEAACKHLQSTENVGKSLIELLKSALNGTVWLSQNDEPAVQINPHNENAIKAINIVE